MCKVPEAMEDGLSIPFLKVKYPKLILKFSAEFCDSCKDPVMLKTLDTLAKTHAYHIEEIDIEKHSVLCEEYCIRHVPTFVLFDDTSEKITIVGGNIESMKQWIMRNKMLDK